mgnify:CR=1 FL=1
MKPYGSILPWWLVLATAAVIFAVVVLTAGCAGAPYWSATHAPILLRGVVEVERPGGEDQFGYANYRTGMIELQPGLKPELRDCVLAHERRHFAGYSHEPRERVLAVDCGDGRVMPL